MKWLSIPEHVGRWLFKAAGHKYIKRVPKAGGGYKYFYAVQHGGGIASTEHFQTGAAFKYKEGHYHVTGTQGDQVTIRHDETGETKTVSKQKLSELLREHHGKALAQHHEKLKGEYEQAGKTGSKKQQQRLEREAKRTGLNLAPQEPSDIEAKFLDLKQAGYDASQIASMLSIPRERVSQLWTSVKPAKVAMSEQLEKVGRRFYVRGNTYHIKEQLKRLGAKWDADQRAWWVSSQNVEHVNRLLTKKSDARSEADRRRQEGLGVKIPFNLKDEAKKHGGIWDQDSKQWLMPTKELASKMRQMGALRSGGGGSGKASEGQVREVMRLIGQGAWFDSDMGQGTYAPSESEVRKWSSKEASDAIADMRGW